MWQGLLLKDKWALVTGASSGIGAAIAEAFAGEGAAVILQAHPLNQDGLDKVPCSYSGQKSYQQFLASCIGPARRPIS